MTNETLKSLKNRRSVRGYKPEMIKEDELNAIIEAGLYAPSAMNQQSWHFTVIQNKEIMDQMSNDTKEIFLNSENPRFKQIASNENFHFFFHAPVVIIISGDEKAILPAVDCAAATQNLLVAAESLGIGSCWVNAVIQLFSGEKADTWKKELGIPEGFKPMYGATFGYKAGADGQAPPRRENTVNFIR